MSESKETKQYLSSLSIERSKENIEFSFDPAVPTEEISETMQDYFRDDILENGGDVVIQTVDGKSCFTKIVIPKSFARKTILAIFRQLEKENICPEITEADLEKSRKKETAGAISTKQQGTGRAVQQAINPKQEPSQERREGPQFGVRARITSAEKRGNDLRLNVDAYLHTGTGRNNRDYERVEAVIFEYNGVQKVLTTSRIGKIRQRTLYFRDAFKTGEKLRVWPKAFPNEFIELTVNMSESSPNSPTSTSPNNGGESLAREVESISYEVRDGVQGLKEKLKEAEQREKELRKQIEEMQKSKSELSRAESYTQQIELISKEWEEERKEKAEKARKAKEKQEADEKESTRLAGEAKKVAEEKARLAEEDRVRQETAEKERKEQELKRIGNAAADYLIYADIANVLPDQQKNRIEQLALKLRAGQVEGSNKKYAETLLEMREKYTPAKVEQTSTGIWVEMKNLMQEIDLPMSAYGASKSWVLWDMAKQTYLAEHSAESNADYTLGNPMENENICRQISDRHLGWELYGLYRSSADARRKIGEVLQNSPHAPRAQQLFNKDPNSRGTLRSIELEVLGEVIRTAMEEKKEEEVARRQAETEAAREKHELSIALRNGTEVSRKSAEDILATKGKLEIQNGQILVLPKGEYKVHADIFIEEGGVLQIQSGTRLSFAEDAGIVSRGTITARGSEDEPIHFDCMEAGKHWKNITIESDEVNILEHCVIEGGGGRYYRVDPANRRAVVDERTDEEFARMGKHGEEMKMKRSTNGGGITCMNGCRNTVINLVVVNNCQAVGTGKDKKTVYSGAGGGIWNYEASPNLLQVSCTENKALNGGGMYIDGGNPNIEEVEFGHNEAKNAGGGLSIVRGSPVVRSCQITQNIANDGGGISVVTSEGSRPQLGNNEVSENIAHGLGGGMYLSLDYNQKTGDAYHPRILAGQVSGNRAKAGGGVYITHNITRWSYDFMHHAFELERVNNTGNKPDDTREVFRTK